MLGNHEQFELRLQLGRRIRSLRKAYGLSQTDFAQYLGMDRSRISRIECGQRTINFDELADICDAFNIDLSTLVAGICLPGPRSSGKSYLTIFGARRHDDEARSHRLLHL